MNKILLIIVVILVPFTFLTHKEEVTPTLMSEVSVKSLEIKEEEQVKQVLVSANTDKSEAFYLDLEDYVIGVVAGEMPASFEMEALKAQAVAARTYAMYKMQNIKGYVLSTTINDQVYLTQEDMQNKWKDTYEYYYNRIKQAVEATKGEVITYNDEIIIAYYFAISNGYTENAIDVFNEDKSYLVSVQSTWDKNYQSYSSSKTISKNDFCNKLNITCEQIEIKDIKRATNNYVRSITINNKTFRGIDIFNKLNLKSTDFEITINDNEITIKTYGFGHGVGLSQYGAQGMATEGYNYQEILKYYYQNTKIANI